MPIIGLILLIGIALAIMLYRRDRKSEATNSKRVFWYDLVLPMPILYILWFCLHASFIAPPESCSSGTPGDCFGYGILAGVVALPLALIFAPIHLGLLLRRFKAAKRA